MKSKLNLSTDQNKQLVGLTVKERLETLKMWLENGEITSLQFQYFKDRWIKRATKIRGTKNLSKSRTVAEGEFNQLIDGLRSRLRFINSEDEGFFRLSEDERQAISYYLTEYSRSSKIDDLLVIGLRYPDEDFNLLSFAYVKRLRMGIESFWVKAWEDSYIPADTIRLMYDEDDKISKSFSLKVLETLFPLIRKQCEKEVLRMWASPNYEDMVREHKRLNSFNKLVKDVSKKINSLRNE